MCRRASSSGTQSSSRSRNSVEFGIGPARFACGQLDATKAETEATARQVKASESALNGVRDEARVGQRTTLDVLNAQQALVNARLNLLTAQHDRVFDRPPEKWSDLNYVF
jgi:hypothetical protein